MQHIQSDRRTDQTVQMYMEMVVNKDRKCHDFISRAEDNNSKLFKKKNSNDLNRGLFQRSDYLACKSKCEYLVRSNPVIVVCTTIFDTPRGTNLENIELISHMQTGHNLSSQH